jgi:hypothetical protein
MYSRTRNQVPDTCFLVYFVDSLRAMTGFLGNLLNPSTRYLSPGFGFAQLKS